MAATTRATTPHAEPFSLLEGPRTPTSLSGGTSAAPAVAGLEHNNLLRPRAQSKSPADLSPKSGAPGLAPRISPVPLTGAAAMADLKRRKQQKTADEARQTSPNPAVAAMQSLAGTGGVSKPSEAPPPDQRPEPVRKPAEKISIPDSHTASGGSLHASPVSLTSFGSIEGTHTMTATADRTDGPPAPAPYAAKSGPAPEGGGYANSLGPARDDGPKAYSYPGLPPPSEPNQGSGPSRGMSYPGLPGSPKSPTSNKKHKCPYCNTDFTRQHNLKSHLLTHSQEKPYVCEVCQARFRRLHDLKRHTKLHTGERPHTCDKCGRRFARGDALARHNKGPGGCAGRRSSFTNDDEFGDGAGPDGMDGVEYGGGGDDDDDGPPEQPRRVSEPSRKRVHLETAQDPQREVYRQHPSTYPPVGPAQGRAHGASATSMGPPQVIYPGSHTTTSPREIPSQLSPAAGAPPAGSSYPPPPYTAAPGGAYNPPPQPMMTESPRPLSPGQPADQHRLSADAAMGLHNRNRSPSLTTQFQQHHFGRGSGGRTPPYPGPVSVPGQPAPHAPLLPPLHAGQPPGRAGLPPSIGGVFGPSTLHQQLPPGTTQSGTGSHKGSLSSHGRSSGSSTREVIGQEPADMWNYIRTLEQKFVRMQDEYDLRISRLHEEIIGLRGQVSQVASYSSDMASRPY